MWMAAALFIALIFAVLPSMLFICNGGERNQQVTSDSSIRKRKRNDRSNHHRKREAVVEKTITVKMHPMSMDEEDAAGFHTFIEQRQQLRIYRKRNRRSTESTNQTTAGEKRTSATQSREEGVRKAIGVIVQTDEEKQNMQIGSNENTLNEKPIMRTQSTSGRVSNSSEKKIDYSQQTQQRQSNKTEQDNTFDSKDMKTIKKLESDEPLASHKNYNVERLDPAWVRQTQPEGHIKELNLRKRAILYKKEIIETNQRASTNSSSSHSHRRRRRKEQNIELTQPGASSPAVVHSQQKRRKNRLVMKKRKQGRVKY